MTENRTSVLGAYIKEKRLDPVKLHLACGGDKWHDFVNIDLYPETEESTDTSRIGCVADVLAEIRILGLQDDSVDEIFCSHALEHFPRWVGVELLVDWHRMLRSGGRLHLETPDFWRSVFWLFHPRRQKRKLARNMFYGNQWDKLEYETHRYFLTARELNGVLLSIGFSSAKVNHATLTHQPGRDIKAIAFK